MSKLREEVVVEEGQPIDNVTLDENGQVIAELSPAGAEILDPVPMEPPIGYKDQPDMWETVQRMVKTELLARELASQDYGSFEEEDDFEVGDDYEPTSPHENEADVSVAELLAAGREELARQQQETVRQDPEPKKAEPKKAGKEDEKGSE